MIFYGGTGMRNDIGGKVLGGLILIAIGVVFLLNQLGIWSVDIGYVFKNYWPVILIMFGLKGILIQRRLDYGWGGSYLWNLIVVVVGLVFLNNNLRWFNQIGFEDIFKFLVPFILIVLGLNMLLRPRKSQKQQPKEQKEPVWTNPTESPFQPYSTYEPPKVPTEPMEPTEPGSPPVTPIPPSPPTGDAPFPPEIEPVIVKDWNNWKEQLKEDWGKHRDSWHKDLSNHNRDKRRDHREQREQHRQQYQHSHDDGVQHRHNFIGDLHVGQDYWELSPMNISHFIGDTELDLTRAVIPYGETKINISAFIGDVKVFVPNDVQLEVSVTASSFLGDISVFERREGGMFRSMQSASPGYKDAEKQVRIVVSMFIGDVRVKRVG